MQVSLSTHIDAFVAKALNDYVERTGKSKASVIEEALRRYLEEEKNN